MIISLSVASLPLSLAVNGSSVAAPEFDNIFPTPIVTLTDCIKIHMRNTSFTVFDQFSKSLFEIHNQLAFLISFVRKLFIQLLIINNGNYDF